MTCADWFVYILQSEATGTLYTGVSNDPWARLVKHNTGKGAKFTRSRRPWKMIYLVGGLSKSEALKAEAWIKKMKRVQKLKLVSGASWAS